MNNSAQIYLWGYALMIGIVIILLGLYLAKPVQDSVNSAMNSTVADTIGLDCGNASISIFDKGACTVTDFSSFYFVATLILIGGGIVVSRILL